MASTNFINGTVIEADWLNDVNDYVYETAYDVRISPYDAVLDGTTDDSTAINAAIVAAHAAGGGDVLIPGIAAIGTTITLRRNVNIIFTGGGYFQWIGATSGTVVQTDQADVVQNCIWRGLAINTGDSFTGIALSLHSMHNITADVIRLVTTGAASTGIRMYADSTGGESELTKRNVTGVKIGQIVHAGTCGTLLETGGVSTSGGAYYVTNGPAVVTLNTIGQIFGENCAVYGIYLKQWTDNNNFPGMNRVLIPANNAIGLQVGGTSATDNLGVYTNVFGTVAIDSFGTYTGRKGVVISRSKLTVITALYNNPIAEGGTFSDDEFAQSYDVTYQEDSTGRFISYKKGYDHVEGAVGFNSSLAISLADDTATSILLADSSDVDQNVICTALVTANNPDATGASWCNIRRSSGSPATATVFGGTNYNSVAGGGILTGTTGTDTKLNVSAAANGRLYVENRLGSTVIIVITILGWRQSP